MLFNKCIAISTGLMLLMSSSMVCFADVNFDESGNVSSQSEQKTEQMTVKVLEDNANVRIAEVTEGNVVTTAIYNKNTGIIEIKENGSSMKIDINNAENLNVSPHIQNSIENSSEVSMMGWGDPSGYSYSEGQEVWGLEYKIYTNDNDQAKRYWKVYGPGWKSGEMNEGPNNSYKLERYKSLVNETQRKWLYAQGLLIGAGAGAIISAALFAVPEPFASKGAAVAALTAAGASGGAALCAGGALYEYSHLYGETKEYYNRNF